jgi:hypothetical protein
VPVNRHEALLLAHQGGWDEMLFVLVPLTVIFTLLVAARRRVEARRAAGTPTTVGHDQPESTNSTTP